VIATIEPAGSYASPRTRQCPLCGHRFVRGEEHCGSCPMVKGCGTILCPRCHYEFLDRSATIEALKRAGRRIAGLLARIRSRSGSAS
jgi:hypothetical protein